MYPNRGIGKCYLCLLVRIECDKISLITLPSLRQEFSDIMWIFQPGFHSCNFPNFSGLYQLVQAGTSSEKFFVGLLMHWGCGEVVYKLYCISLVVGHICNFKLQVQESSRSYRHLILLFVDHAKQPWHRWVTITVKQRHPAHYPTKSTV